VLKRQRMRFVDMITFRVWGRLRSWACGVGLCGAEGFRPHARTQSRGNLGELGELDGKKPNMLRSCKFSFPPNRHELLSSPVSRLLPPPNCTLTGFLTPRCRPTRSPSKTRGRIAIITLNRQKKLNALDQDLYFRLATLMHERCGYAGHLHHRPDRHRSLLLSVRQKS